MILVSGADGFVGRHLTSSLRSDGVRVEAMRADITDALAVQAALGGAACSVLIHLAALSSVSLSETGAAETWRVNVAGAVNAAEAVWKANPSATVVFASSAEVYGESFDDGRPVDEDAALRPLSVYGRTKAAAELALSDIRPAAGRLIVLRMFNQIGPGQDQAFALPTFASQIARIEQGLQDPVLRTGDLTAIRDFVDVRDGVRAYGLALRHAPDAARTCLNVCSGIGRSVEVLLKGMLALSDQAIGVELDPTRLRPSGIQSATGNAGALHRLTGWSPELPLARTLSDTLDDARRRIAVEKARTTLTD